MILLISTADSDWMMVGLAKNGQLVSFKKIKAKARQSEKLISEISKILKVNGVKIFNLRAIAVVSGPASFTALRIGVATANALAWSLNIPVVGFTKNNFSDFKDLAFKAEKKVKGNKFKNIVLPHYGKDANITKPKR